MSISPELTIRNYVALGATNIGKLWAPGPDGRRRPDGTIYAQSDTRLKDISDGASHTLVIAETREQNVAVWIDGTGAAAVGRPFDSGNTPSYAAGVSALNYQPYYHWGDDNDSVNCQFGPSSMHAGVVGHLAADGSARFLVDTTDPTLYDALITRAGGEPMDAVQ